jgi:hypothetical protein
MRAAKGEELGHKSSHKGRGARVASEQPQPRGGRRSNPRPYGWPMRPLPGHWVAGAATDLGSEWLRRPPYGLDLWPRRPPRGLGVATQATRGLGVVGAATPVHHMAGRPKRRSSDREMGFFSDSSAEAVMVNQVGGGLGGGIKSGWWERRVLGGARWAAWACRSRLGWRCHYLRGAVFVIRCFC